MDKKEKKQKIQALLEQYDAVQQKIISYNRKYEEVLLPVKSKIDKINYKIEQGQKLAETLQKEILEIASDESLRKEKIQSFNHEIKFTERETPTYSDESSIIKFLQDRSENYLLKETISINKNEFKSWYKERKARESDKFTVPGFTLEKVLKPNISQIKRTI